MSVGPAKMTNFEGKGKPPREFEIEAERMHIQVQEMMKKNKIHQTEMREMYTKNENGQLLKGNGDKASEADEERLEKRVEKVMLTNNPLFDDNDSQYKDGLIYPIDWKVIKHKEKKEASKGSNL